MLKALKVSLAFQFSIVLHVLVERQSKSGSILRCVVGPCDSDSNSLGKLSKSCQPMEVEKLFLFLFGSKSKLKQLRRRPWLATVPICWLGALQICSTWICILQSSAVFVCDVWEHFKCVGLGILREADAGKGQTPCMYRSDRSQSKNRNGFS